MLDKGSKIYIAGHHGMVGSACLRLFLKKGYKNIIGKDSNELDLRNSSLVKSFFKNERPEYVINSAAVVGGILSNSNNPYKFLLNNLQIQNNLISYSHEYDVKKFIFLGSSCIYPRMSPQPINEDYLLSGKLEKTNQWYAIAKIAGVKLCDAINKEFNKDFLSLMPTNLYGPNDNFDLKTSHVIPALIRKFHEGKQNNSDVILWGSGKPKREFLHVDDLAEAVYFALKNKLDENIYNVGSGVDMTIKDLSLMISNIVNFKGKIKWDNSMPDGTPRKILDSSKFKKLGWNSKIMINDGLKNTYSWYKNNV